MIPTHEQVTGGEEYLGFARHKLAFLEMARREAGSPSMTWGPKDVDSATIYIRSADDGNLIRIDGGGSGLICHPRSASYPGGILPGGVGISTVYGYPLVDDDHGSFVLTPDGKTPPAWAVSRDAENYGNIDWQGDDGTILSWRGPASRHFPLSAIINYSGFTVFDMTIGEPPFETDYFTPFGPNIYQEGSILTTLPGAKILGAAIVKGMLTVVASFLSGTYTDEVWQQNNGWHKIWSKGGSRPYVCWFFASDGLHAYRGREVLDFTGQSPQWSENGDTGGSATFQMVYPSTYNLIKNGTWHPYRETGSLAITLHSTDNTAVTGQGDTTTDQVPVYILSDTPPVPLSVWGPDAYTPGAYTGAGGEGPYEITEPDPDACGTQYVTVTDRCGATASKAVRMSDGTWIFDSSTMSGCSSSGNQYTSFTCISGGTKKVSYCTQDCGCDSDFDYNGDPNQTSCPGFHTPAPTCPSACSPAKTPCNYVESEYGKNVYGYHIWDEYQLDTYHWGCP